MYFACSLLLPFLRGGRFQGGEPKPLPCSFRAGSPFRPIDPVFACGANAQIGHRLIDGQSNAFGSADPTVVTPLAVTGGLRFAGGVRPGSSFASLVPLLETTSSSSGETLGSGSVLQYAAAWANDDLGALGAGRDVLVSDCAVPGTTVADRAPGTAFHDTGNNHIAQAVIRAAALGKTYALESIVNIDGESDAAAGTAPAAYMTGLTAIHDARIAHYQTQTGRKGLIGRVPIVLVQMSQFSAFAAPSGLPLIAWAQLDLTRERPDFMIATPGYIFDFIEQVGGSPIRGQHYTASSKRQIGAYVGHALKQAVINGRAHRPTAPVCGERNGQFIDVVFEAPQLPLVLDTSRVAQLADGCFGFRWFTQNGSLLIQSAAPAVVAPDTVRFTFATEVIARSATVLRSADYNDDPAKPNWSGRLYGPRCCLRDSTSAVHVDETGASIPLHSYCVVFNLEVP